MPTCWPDAHDEPGVLYIAALLRSDSCIDLTAIHADLSKPATLQVWSDGSNVCPIGARSAAAAGLVRMDLPFNVVPRGTTLTVNLVLAPGGLPMSSATVGLP
jgi:hypothetical protein